MNPEPYQVWARALWAVLDLAELGGVDASPVFDGMPFDADTLRSRRTVDWSDFCVVCERLEERCGGPEICQELFATSYHRVLPEFRGLIGGLMSPISFARLSLEMISPIVYQGCSFTMRELGDDRIQLRLRLRPGARPSLTFFRATVGELRALPRHLGLEPATVSANFSPNHGDYDVHFPQSRSVVDRVLQIGREIRIVLGHTGDGQPLALSLGDGDDGIDARMRSAMQLWQLTARQIDVLRRLAEGASNKEIASDLGCAENTVELHVTRLLGKAGVESRGRLMALFWSRL